MSLYVPAAHGKQVDDPNEEDIPAGHTVQLFRSGPAYPGLQLQSESNVLSVGDEVFAGHVTHRLDPVPSLNVPALHPVHVPPSKPV